MTNLFSYLRRRKNLNGTTMISFPNAKINIGLNVIGKRPDGYHDIETVFCPVGLRDALEFRAANGKTSLRISGKSVDGEMENNLTVRALRLMQRDFHVPELEICLHKCIPMGAGLGGGSADAAFMLRMINEEFRLNLQESELERYAASLGADCPFFIRNKAVFAEGIGDVFSPVELPLGDYGLYLIKPDIHVPTAEAYAQIIPQKWDIPLREAVKRPVSEWKELVSNDFERGVFARHPLLGEIKETLYNHGAAYASMSGSGSAIYGIFRKDSMPDTIPVPDGCEIFVSKTIEGNMQ